jgi:hypothetical protein
MLTGMFARVIAWMFPFVDPVKKQWCARGCQMMELTWAPVENRRIVFIEPVAVRT